MNQQPKVADVTDKETYVQLLTECNGNLTHVAAKIGKTQAAVGAAVKRYGLTEQADAAAAKVGWSRRGRPSRLFTGNPQTVVDMVRCQGVSATALELKYSTKRIHEICESIGATFRGVRIGRKAPKTPVTATEG